MKTCSKCKENKDLSEFRKDAKSKDGHQWSCKTCYRIKKSNRSQEEKDIERTKNQLWNNNNKEKLKEVKKAWKEEKREKVRTYEKEWHSNNKENRAKQAREKYNDPNSSFKIKANLRTRFSNAIKRGQKAGSAIDDLGCSIEEFKVYIESKFEPWMNWDNYGNYDKDKDTWQFDHIVALANIDLTNREEFLKAAHFSNYQPLLVLDNIKKSNK